MYHAFYECDIEECIFSRINSNLRHSIETKLPDFMESYYKYSTSRNNLVMATIYSQNMLSEMISLTNIKKRLPHIKTLSLHCFNPDGYDLPQLTGDKYKMRVHFWSIVKKYLEFIGFEEVEIYTHTSVPQVHIDLFYGMDYTNPNFYPSPSHCEQIGRWFNERSIVVDCYRNYENGVVQCYIAIFNNSVKKLFMNMLKNLHITEQDFENICSHSDLERMIADKCKSFTQEELKIINEPCMKEQDSLFIVPIDMENIEEKMIYNRNYRNKLKV